MKENFNSLWFQKVVAGFFSPHISFCSLVAVNFISLFSSHLDRTCNEENITERENLADFELITFQRGSKEKRRAVSVLLSVGEEGYVACQQHSCQETILSAL